MEIRGFVLIYGLENPAALATNGGEGDGLGVRDAGFAALGAAGAEVRVDRRLDSALPFEGAGYWAAILAGAAFGSRIG